MSPLLDNLEGPVIKDALTGVWNKKTFQKAFTYLMNHARSTNEPLSLANFDIDHFLEVNDTYGHTGGDHVLVSVAEKAMRITGDAGVVARYGGDEFIAILPGVGREKAILLMERIREAIDLEKQYGVGGEAFEAHITISIGLASFPVDGRTESELMRKANMALYRAKLDQRNTIRLAVEEKMVTKTTHFPQTQLERLEKLSADQKVGEAELLREALDDLITKYDVKDILDRDAGGRH